MKAVILSGGLGSRLRPFTQVIPKPLLPVGERSVLEIQLEQLKKAGFNEIILATNYKSQYIANFFGDGSQYGVKLTISKEEQPLGTAGPLTLLKDQLTEPFLMMNGDILTLLRFDAMHQFAVEQDSLLTLGTKEIVQPFAFGNVFFDGSLVTGIEEKPDIKNTIVAGIYIMKPGIFELLPENTYFGMDDLMKLMLRDGLPITKYDIREYWLDIGRVDDYEEAQEVFETHFKEVV